jgi:hypothetical protein
MNGYVHDFAKQVPVTIRCINLLKFNKLHGIYAAPRSPGPYQNGVLFFKITGCAATV